MWRIGIVYKNGEISHQDKKTKKEAENFIEKIVEQGNIKRTVLVNKDNILERYAINWE